MEEKNKDEDDYSFSFSWWSDSHNRLHRSLWLQATLSDLDNKTKTIVNIIQDGGDTFAKSAEMFYRRRAELINMVQHLHKSYSSLAENYDQLRSHHQCINHLRPRPSPLCSSKLFDHKESTKLEGQGQAPTTDTHHFLSGLENESIIMSREEDQIPHVNDGKQLAIGRLDLGGKEKLRNQLREQVCELIQDNLLQQSELIKRNEEKREIIKYLRAQINRLMEENRVLKSNLPSYKVVSDMKRNSTTKSHASNSKIKGGFNCIPRFQIQG